MSGTCDGAIETALVILVGKWKPVVLLHIIQKGTSALVNYNT